VSLIRNNNPTTIREKKKKQKRNKKERWLVHCGDFSPTKGGKTKQNKTKQNRLHCVFEDKRNKTDTTPVAAPSFFLLSSKKKISKINMSKGGDSSTDDQDLPKAVVNRLIKASVASFVHLQLASPSQLLYSSLIMFKWQVMRSWLSQRQQRFSFSTQVLGM